LESAATIGGPPELLVASALARGHGSFPDRRGSKDGCGRKEKNQCYPVDGSPREWLIATALMPPLLNVRAFRQPLSADYQQCSGVPIGMGVAFAEPVPHLLLRADPELCGQALFIWQVATYLFLHGASGTSSSICWRCDVRIRPGDKLGDAAFLRYYFFTGSARGFAWWCSTISSQSEPADHRRVGAIYGILMAWAVLARPDHSVQLLFPMKVKYFVMIFGRSNCSIRST